MPKIALRKPYLQEQAALGRRPLGVFPALYPRELMWAFDILPVEIWDPPLPLAAAHAHLQPYICSVVRQGLELILSGGADQAKAFLFPHTCDSIQNLASVVHDYIGQDKPCYFFYHPKEPYGAPARAYYLAQLKSLADSLSAQFGPLDLARLKEAVALGGELAGLVRRMYDLRAAGQLRATGQEFYAALRRGEWLWPTDWREELQEFLAAHSGPALAGPAVLISGILPSPAQVLEVLDQAGVRIAHDDLLACSRRWLFSPSQAVDPWEALTEQYFSLPPCPTRGSSLAARRDHLLDLAQKGGARGVVFLGVKFCEPELFDLPILSEEIKAAGLPVLVLDVEIGQQLSGQLATRLEAFLEMLEG